MIQTRDIDASIKVVKPENRVKAKTLTTTTMQDIADIEEKNRRDKIMVEKVKWEKKIKMEKVRAAKNKTGKEKK